MTSGCASSGILDTAGPIAAANRTILLNAVVIMLVIIVPTMIATIAFAWWYREGNERAVYRPEFVYSGRVEMLVWSIPILTILFLGGVIWIGSQELDPHRPLASKVPPLEVQVVSLDWKWLFIYPAQGIASVNLLVLPTGVPIHFRLTSASVMNVFFIPQLGSQIYAMNGMATELWLQADRPGAYYGRSAHFSGDGFPEMSFTTRAVPPDEFAAWASHTRGQGPALDLRSWPKLAEQERNVAPFTFGAVQPGLFEAVATQKIPPAGAPKEGHGGPGIKPVGGQ